MIYFDNSATTKPYSEVIESFIKVSTDYFGNPSSLHGLGVQSEKLLSAARKQIAELLKVKSSEIYFTSGGTEGNNLAIKGAAFSHANRGKHIITTAIEHPSVEDACHSLTKQGYEITYLPVNEYGQIALADLKHALREDTILVSVMHVNNEVGSIQPIVEIGKLLREYPQVLFHVDNVQGAGKISLSLRDANVDLCTISGHKVHGLKGTGILYIRDGVRIDPLFHGGNQETKIRSGTENVAGIVALSKAFRISMNNQLLYHDKLQQINKYLYKGLQEMDGVLVNSPEEGAHHILNFSVPGLKSEVLLHALEADGIYVSTTSACSSKKRTVSKTVDAMFHNQARSESVIRISTTYSNEMEEAEKVLAAIQKIVVNLEKIMRVAK
ncbi:MULTISPECIES: cysteine desulfurase family protein [unclassified Peribacillus]|uniref:cysteine desulfurase family protein n=1 Tax=unclassified Peribacillus TaxID=2675266 RepID=UPI001911930C|nr:MULTISPECIES: cysteine desulfurase family protein [unclassified Peribacillus]MBK5462304.1 cysteine desulfurase [Peribacillus sp. TH27]MBK5500454.1 cysteine desulfurase [Peribacillus sp. TH14]WMX54515.1 cysteine desulfurase family protein [Peribacillus sp. R9-11]